jgi:GTP-binding protein
LAQKREIIALSKADSAPADYLDDLKAALKAEGADDVMIMSSVTGQGVTDVLRALYAVITQEVAAELAKDKDDEPWSP